VEPLRPPGTPHVLPTRRGGQVPLARRRRPRPIPRAAVPSAFTLGNLLSGFFSIVLASEGRLEFAAWLIVLAAFFDLLDGMVARIAGGDSRFGVELDSLCDVVSFGVAPSFLLFQFGLKDFPFGAFIASLPALCGAVRLARFNTLQAGGEKTNYFTGLPIPAEAGTIVAFILTFEDDRWFSALERGRLSFLLPLTVLLSALMVSPVRFPALPHPSRAALRKYPWRFVGFVTGLVLTLTLGEIGLLVSAVVYLAIGIGGAFLWAFRAARGGGNGTHPPAIAPAADPGADLPSEPL
jgi:CDP-diacylglycerol--serine O-phosphatidyltransferase